MKAFIVLCAIIVAVTASPGYLPYHQQYQYGSAPLGHDGRVIETAEVAHARAAHLAEHAKESARNSAVHYIATPYVHHHHHHQVYAPIIAHKSIAPLDYKTGRVIDEPIVAHAKAAHLVAHAQEAAKNSGHYAALSYGYSPIYAHGYPVYNAAPLGIDGRVVDEPIVAHAKAAHLAAHAQEAAKTSGHNAALSYAYSPVYAHGYTSVNNVAPLGIDGRVVDEPAVAHAKAAHLAAHHQAAIASHYHY